MVEYFAIRSQLQTCSGAYDNFVGRYLRPGGHRPPRAGHEISGATTSAEGAALECLECRTPGADFSTRIPTAAGRCRVALRPQSEATIFGRYPPVLIVWQRSPH